jgi:hypothetical protein
MNAYNLGLAALAFRLIGWVASVGVVYLVARLWTLKPDAALVRFVKHPRRTWFGLGLLGLVLVAGHVVSWWVMAMVARSHDQFQFYPAGTVLWDFVLGLLWGLIVCLLAPLADNGRRFLHWSAIWIVTGLAVMSLLISLFPFRVVQNLHLMDISTVLFFLTLMAARSFPRQQVEPSPEGAPAGNSKSPALALILAFLPSAMLLVLLPALNQSQPPTWLFILCCGVSVVCCFSASFMLFSRRTGLATFGGVIFLLLNAFVSFLFGCGALLTQMKF